MTKKNARRKFSSLNQRLSVDRSKKLSGATDVFVDLLDLRVIRREMGAENRHRPLVMRQGVIERSLFFQNESEIGQSRGDGNVFGGKTFRFRFQSVLIKLQRVIEIVHRQINVADVVVRGAEFNVVLLSNSQRALMKIQRVGEIAFALVNAADVVPNVGQLEIIVAESVRPDLRRFLKKVQGPSEFAAFLLNAAETTESLGRSRIVGVERFQRLLVPLGTGLQIVLAQGDQSQSVKTSTLLRFGEIFAHFSEEFLRQVEFAHLIKKIAEREVRRLIGLKVKLGFQLLVESTEILVVVVDQRQTNDREARLVAFDASQPKLRVAGKQKLAAVHLVTGRAEIGERFRRLSVDFHQDFLLGVSKRIVLQKIRREVSIEIRGEKGRDGNERADRRFQLVEFSDRQNLAAIKPNGRRTSIRFDLILQIAKKKPQKKQNVEVFRSNRFVQQTREKRVARQPPDRPVRLISLFEFFDDRIVFVDFLDETNELTFLVAVAFHLPERLAEQLKFEKFAFLVAPGDQQWVVHFIFVAFFQIAANLPDQLVETRVNAADLNEQSRTFVSSIRYFGKRPGEIFVLLLVHAVNVNGENLSQLMDFRDQGESHRAADDQRNAIVFRRSTEKRFAFVLVRQRAKLLNQLSKFFLRGATVLVVVQRCVEPNQIQRFKVVLIRHRQPVDSLSSSRRMAKRIDEFNINLSK